MPGFIEKNRVPNRHLYPDFENNERKEVNRTTCDIVSSVLSEDNSN